MKNQTPQFIVKMTKQIYYSSKSKQSQFSMNIMTNHLIMTNFVSNLKLNKAISKRKNYMNRKAITYACIYTNYSFINSIKKSCNS